MRLLLALGLACVLSVAGRANSLEWFESARMGDWPVLERHLSAGTDINLADYTGMTALHHALALGQGGVVRQLVEHGADIAKASKDHSTWDWAVYGGDIEAFRLLLDRGRPSQLDKKTMLHLFDQSIAFGRGTFVDELERRGFRLTKGTELDDALITAVRCEQPVLTERLIALGANPNRPASNGEYPLARAALLDRTDLLDILLRNGAHIDQQGGDIIGNFSSMTALTTAVMADRRAAVRYLLQHGADHRALDNRAVQLADLIGDPQIFTALAQAGARPPAPFSFAKWMTGAQPLPEKPANTTTAEYWGRQLAAMGVFRTDNPTPDALDGRKIAILTLDDRMNDAGALLTARLTVETGATLLERDEIRRIAREKNVQAMLATPGQERVVGQLLGADLLVILREHRFDNESLREAKITAVKTGIVVGTALSANKAPLDAWVSETVSICSSAAPLTLATLDGIRLVSVPRVVAALNTPLGRELERQFTVTLAARIGRLPGVVVVERNDLDRLALEQDPSVSNYAASSWLMDATLDLPAGSTARDLKLRVTLKTRAGADNQTIEIDGTIDDPATLADRVVAQVGQIITGTPVAPWNTRDEAGAFVEKARQFKQAFLWPDVASAVEAARALGLENDDVTALRMEAAVQRILHSSQQLLAHKRQRRDYHGIAELIAYRAPLLMPVEDSRELDLQGYLDYANLTLDIFAASLDRPGAKMAGTPFDRWVCGEFWDAATVPLRLTEPVSYQAEYGDDFRALRARLLDLNDRAVQLARERGDAIACQTLVGIRLRHLAHWMPDEEVFQTEVRAILARALDWTAPFSAQSVWTTAYRTARDNTHKIGGRARQAWIRLAGALAVSDNPEERYLGTCVLGMQTFSPGLYWNAVKSLRDQFPDINRRDRGITTEMYKIGAETTDTPHISSDFLNWYEDAFVGLLGHDTWSMTYEGLWKVTTWSMTGKNGGYAPEFRAFMLEQTLLRAQTISSGIPGGLTDISFNESRGFTPAELGKLSRAFSEALPVSESLGSFGKQTAYAVDRARYLAKTRGTQPAAQANSARIVATPIANPFFALIPVTPEQRASTRIATINNGMNTENGWNLLVRETYLKTTGARIRDYFYYRFDASGQPVDIHPIPDDILEKVSTYGDYLMHNDRWLVVFGMRGSKDVWLSADRSHTPWQWRIHDAASTDGKLVRGALVGDHLVYPFIHNPTAPRSGVPERYETKGDPTFGVVDIDLNTGKETLVASSRRQPPVTPVESEQIAPFKSVRQVSPTGVVIGGKQKSSAQVYDTVSGSWTPYDEAFKAAQHKSAPASPLPRPGYVNVDGVDWNITYDIKNGLMPVFIPGKNKQFYIPVDLPDADLSAYSDYEYALNIYALNKDQTDRSTSWHPDGLVVGAGCGFYHWIPMDQIRDAIRAQLRNTN